MAIIEHWNILGWRRGRGQSGNRPISSTLCPHMPWEQKREAFTLHSISLREGQTFTMRPTAAKSCPEDRPTTISCRYDRKKTSTRIDGFPSIFPSIQSEKSTNKCLMVRVKTTIDTETKRSTWPQTRYGTGALERTPMGKVNPSSSRFPLALPRLSSVVIVVKVSQGKEKKIFLLSPRSSSGAGELIIIFLLRLPSFSFFQYDTWKTSPFRLFSPFPGVPFLINSEGFIDSPLRRFNARSQILRSPVAFRFERNFPLQLPPNSSNKISIMAVSILMCMGSIFKSFPFHAVSNDLKWEVVFCIFTTFMTTMTKRAFTNQQISTCRVRYCSRYSKWNSKLTWYLDTWASKNRTYSFQWSDGVRVY